MRSTGTDPAQPAPSIIYGAGGHARELRFELEHDGWPVRAFVDDFHNGRDVDGLPVLSFDEAHNALANCTWFVAIGAPADRKTLSERVRAAGLTVGTFVSSGARVLPTAKIGLGSQVFHGAVLSAGVTVGEFAIVNFGSVISHDVSIGDYATVTPGVHVAGNVKVGCGAWLGVGASVRNGTSSNPILIGDWSVIGAGACVIGSIPKDDVVVGVPSRPLQRKL